jgi:hypothetical protein
MRSIGIRNATIAAMNLSIASRGIGFFPCIGAGDL